MAATINSKPLATPSYESGFVEIARATIYFNANGFTWGPLAFPAKNYLHLIIRLRSGVSANTVACTLRFNGDSGANYAQRTSTAGAADATSTGLTGISLMVTPGNATTANWWADLWINNYPSTAVHRVLHGHEDLSVGSATVPTRVEISACWASTVQITDIRLVFASTTGPYIIDGEVIVLGTD